MRVLRAKHIRKYLRFYRLIFGIEAPFHVILDGNFIFTAFKYKLDIVHRLQSLLQESSIQTYVLRSVIDELKAVGQKAESSLQWAMACCTVIDDSDITNRNPAERIVELLGKTKGTKKYFVASQDKDVRVAVGHIPGVPILYFNKVTLVLESPSESSRNFNNKIEELKTSGLLATELELLSASPQANNEDDKNADDDNNDKPKPRLKRKASAPNPLSNQSRKDHSHNSSKAKKSKFRHG